MWSTSSIRISPSSFASPQQEFALFIFRGPADLGGSHKCSQGTFHEAKNDNQTRFHFMKAGSIRHHENALRSLSLQYFSYYASALMCIIPLLLHIYMLFVKCFTQISRKIFKFLSMHFLRCGPISSFLFYSFSLFPPYPPMLSAILPLLAGICFRR